jgi:hypothetical protein
LEKEMEQKAIIALGQIFNERGVVALVAECRKRLKAMPDSEAQWLQAINDFGCQGVMHRETSRQEVKKAFAEAEGQHGRICLQ